MISIKILPHMCHIYTINKILRWI